MPQRRIQASHFSKDVQELFGCFRDHAVRFLLIGGEAVIFHGHPRFTGDVDCWFDCQPENAERVYQALRVFWGGAVPSISDANELTEYGMVFQFGRPPNRVDLLTAVDGLCFESAWESREEALLVDGDQEYPLAFLGLADLITSKEAAGRHKDLEDLRYLRSKS